VCCAGYRLSGYPLLKDCLEDEEKKKFNNKMFRCSLGIPPTFYMNASGVGQYKSFNEKALREECKSRLEDASWVRDPAYVSLGIDHSWVLLGKKGDLLWDLKGHYTDLDKALQETTIGVRVSTSQYAFLIFAP
jgi:hypothetical protein